MSNEFEAAIRAASDALTLHIRAIQNRRTVEMLELSPKEDGRLLDIIDNIETVRADLSEWMDAFGGADDSDDSDDSDDE